MKGIVGMWKDGMAGVGNELMNQLTPEIVSISKADHIMHNVERRRKEVDEGKWRIKLTSAKGLCMREAAQSDNYKNQCKVKSRYLRRGIMREFKIKQKRSQTPFVLLPLLRDQNHVQILIHQPRPLPTK